MDSRAVLEYLKHNPAVSLVIRVLKIQSVTIPIHWLAVVAIMLPGVQTPAF